MKLLYSLLLFVALVCNLAYSHIGIDFAFGSNVADLSCFKGKGYSKAIIRCYQSIGQIDPNCKSSIENAKKAGLSVDVYIFPCYNCGNPSNQVESTVNYIKSYIDNKSVGTVWLDVEGPGAYWSNDHSANAKFFEGLVAGGKKAGAKIGVYTSASQWEPIMGSYTGGKDFPLWYAHYDNDASFKDFTAFGGWSKPYMKQYQGDVSECGLGVDKNYWA
ncbi:hypothetical protein DICPUDRAFT_39207 [Dictyostelium purpureum]|uniref:lysozyme n=1 Tax=Dictyostelium purpureum TaxID=5786 RepID=F0ZVX8_DICPU|nr:uncharacterized protein DICPUDRAFT_39207 [Dictyostelium purpureum]EGC31899.1 hypothetical protein DICPUDRAFT_39207 [Dictyostelium purpureum]|eukprot:XP_003291569.1 hypothetical protein DICPUDRAFT_39207 [Dictyostelium purpureum]